jgi:hypothetical protein
VEAAYPGPHRALGERGEQGGAHPVALPAVDHLDRHLGLVERLESHVAGDPDRLARRRRERDQSLVVPVVDVEQAVQLARRQDRLDGEVALMARALAQPAEGEREGPAVGGGELADGDVTPHR